MATSIFHKLLSRRSQSAGNIIVRLNRPHPPLPPPFLLTQIPNQNAPLGHLPLPGLPEGEQRSKAEVSVSSCIYPSFSFGVFLDPTSPTGPIRLGMNGFVLDDYRMTLECSDSSVGSMRPGIDEVGLDDSRTIYADSVKKKRKRKMNKHKLRKLRKRLRRKT